MTRWSRRGLFTLGLVVTVLAGRWGKSLFAKSEYVHFSVNFPTEAGYEQLPLADVGGPWTRLPKADWPGYPAGGVLVWGREGHIEVDLGERGMLKRWLQPGRLLLSTHWLRNVGLEPRRVALDLDLCGLPLRWVTFERDWDQNERAFTRSIAPGKTGNMDWMVDLPDSWGAVVCHGELRVSDADTNEILTRMSLDVIDSSMGDTSKALAAAGRNP